MTNDPQGDYSSKAPSSSSGDNTGSSDFGTLIKDVLQSLMNGQPGDAARAIAESSSAQAAVQGAISGTAEALSTIGDELIKEQP